MGELLAKSAVARIPQKGEIVPGIITKLTPSEILVDINTKTEAVVLEKEKRLLKSLLSHLSVGDKVTVGILNPESDLGHPVVSLRRFLTELQWNELTILKKEQKQIPATVAGLSKGGFLIETSSGASGFLPQSQGALLPFSESTVGKPISVFVWELDKTQKKVIFSQKPILDTSEFKKAAKALHLGQHVLVTITGITPFGLFVSLPSSLKNVRLDGLIHISEVAWEKTETLEGRFTVGQQTDAVITDIDSAQKRIALSLKRLSEDPFESQVKSLKVDQEVRVRVKQVTQAGVLVELSEQLEGMIRKDKVPPSVTYQEGDHLTATITTIDLKKRKILLTPSLATKPIGYR